MRCRALHDHSRILVDPEAGKIQHLVGNDMILAQRIGRNRFLPSSEVFIKFAALLAVHAPLDACAGARFLYSRSGTDFVPLGGPLTSKPGRWVGGIGIFAQPQPGRLCRD